MTEPDWGYGRRAVVPPPPIPSAEERAVHDERWAVPWGLLDVLGVLVVTVVATIVLLLAFIALAPPETPQWAQGLALPVPLVVLALVTVGWVHVRYRSAGLLTGPERASPREWLVGLAWGAGAFLAINVLFVLAIQAVAAVMGIDLPEPQAGIREFAGDPGYVPWLLLSAVVVAPLAEELYFRGMLFQALRRRRRPWTAIGVSAVVFAAAHVVQEATGPAGVLVLALILPMGLVLGWAFERRGNLATPIAVHAAFNLATTLVLLAAASTGAMGARGL